MVFDPETEHDEAVLKVLEKLPSTYRADFYDRAGGWTAFSEYAGKKKQLVIVFELAAAGSSQKPLKNPKETIE